MKDMPIKCTELLSLMAHDDDDLLQKMVLNLDDGNGQPPADTDIYPVMENQLHTLPNGHRYLAQWIRRDKLDMPMFDNYDYHLLAECSEGTMLVTRLVLPDEYCGADEDCETHSSHSSDTIEGPASQSLTGEKKNAETTAEKCSKQHDTEMVEAGETNETNGTAGAPEPQVLVYAPQALCDYRATHAGDRPAAAWLGEMAALPPGTDYHYWLAKEDERACMVKERGVFFGFAAEGGRMLVWEAYAAMETVQLPQPLLPVRLDAYLSMVNGLCGRIAMEDAFREETFAAKCSLTPEKRRMIMELLEPARKLMAEGLPFSWEKLWNRILGDRFLSAQLSNTARTKFKEYHQPLLASLVCQLQRKGVIREYEAADLAEQMGFAYDDSFRQYLGKMPEKKEIRHAVDAILTELKAK